MIKLIAFDVDGTLCSTKELHYESLNRSLSELAPEYVISLEDHLKNYDGKPTKTKLLQLNNKGLPELLNTEIERRKQVYTQAMIKEIIKKEDYLHVKDCIVRLKADYKVVACSNAVLNSVLEMIHCSIGNNLFDAIYWNESVKYPKPSPQMYLKTMVDFNVGPKETLIVEDSEVGLKAARASCAYVLSVKGPEDITYSNLISRIDSING